MKLSDVRNRLRAPFSSHAVTWKPGAVNREKTRALMMPFIDARAVMDRLDAVCPDDWSFEAVEVTGAKVPTVRGTLTVLGVSRTDFGEGDPSTEAGDSDKAACSDALKRCAVHFGIGRYLYDLPRAWVEWDQAGRKPVRLPTLPDSASRPDHERSPGGAHLVQALEQLRMELPGDVDAQREVYRHLKAALGSLHPGAQSSGREAESEGDPAAPPTEPESPSPISQATKQKLAQHITRRWKLEREQRLSFTAWLAGRGEALASSGQLSEAEGQRVLARLSAPDSIHLMQRWGRAGAVA